MGLRIAWAKLCMVARGSVVARWRAWRELIRWIPKWAAGVSDKLTESIDAKHAERVDAEEARPDKRRPVAPIISFADVVS